MADEKKPNALQKPLTPSPALAAVAAPTAKEPSTPQRRIPNVRITTPQPLHFTRTESLGGRSRRRIPRLGAPVEAVGRTSGIRA